MKAITIANHTYTIDLSKGFDIMRGKTAVDHAESYEVAKRKLAQYRGAYIRYFVKKGRWKAFFFYAKKLDVLRLSMTIDLFEKR